MEPSFEINSSKRHGRGVFAARDLRRGEVIERSPTLAFSASEWSDHAAHTALREYCFHHPSAEPLHLLCLGVGSLFNHSRKPNTTWRVDPDDNSITFRVSHAVPRIRAGTELVTCYGTAPLGFDYTPRFESADSESSEEEEETAAAAAVAGVSAGESGPAAAAAALAGASRFDTVAMWDRFHASDGGNDGLYDWYSAGELVAQICAALASPALRRRARRGTGDAAASYDVGAALLGVVAAAEAATTRASAAPLTAAAIAMVGVDSTHPPLPPLAVLDVGIGTSEVLFHLAPAAASFRELVGVDFSATCIERLQREVVARRLDASRVRFYVADALELSSAALALDSVAITPDIIIDKGCLDCFVNTLTETTLGRVHRYLGEVATLLERSSRGVGDSGSGEGEGADDGATLVLLPVSNCDIPHLMATGCVRPYDGGMKAPCESCGVTGLSPAQSEDYTQRLWIHAIIGAAQKHVYICKAFPPRQAAVAAAVEEEGEGAPPLVVRCFTCSAASVYTTVGRVGGADAAEEGRCACGEVIRRFAMS